MFTYIGVLMVIVQGGMVRRLVPRFGERKLIIIGTLLMGVGFFMTTRRLSAAVLMFAIAVTADRQRAQHAVAVVADLARRLGRSPGRRARRLAVDAARWRASSARSSAPGRSASA